MVNGMKIGNGKWKMALERDLRLELLGNGMEVGNVKSELGCQWEMGSGEWDEHEKRKMGSEWEMRMKIEMDNRSLETA